MSLNLDLNCQDTICAPATVAGKSALCVIRVSGPQALQIKDRIFRPKKGNHLPFKATLGDIFDGYEVLDEVLCTYFPGSRSFTGESSFEISAHGNPVILNSILALLKQHGCRSAGPGEFSLRSVIHGKMDLSQAESVADLIDAQSPQGVKIALNNLKGGLERILEPIRGTIISVLCEIEARLDFPDEGLMEKHKAALLLDLQNARQGLLDLISRSARSSKLMQGYRIVLYGRPNAGKSTLLNALIGEDRSIVHESAGTTRDVLEVPWQFKKLPVLLVDVAGIRNDDDVHPVEAIGIARAKKELERADLILNLVDLTEEAQHCERPKSQAPIITVFTKCDLFMDAIRDSKDLYISAKCGYGLDSLIKRIEDLISQDLPDSNAILLTRLRHVELIAAAESSLAQAIGSFSRNLFDECVAYDLREAGNFLDELFGKQLNEEILDLIFSRFCIGK